MVLCHHGGYLSYLLPKLEDLVPTSLGSGAISTCRKCVTVTADYCTSLYCPESKSRAECCAINKKAFVTFPFYFSFRNGSADPQSDHRSFGFALIFVRNGNNSTTDILQQKFLKSVSKVLGKMCDFRTSYFASVTISASANNLLS